jgi:hypothetical protein
VARAVPVERDDVEKRDALHAAGIAGQIDRAHERGIGLGERKEAQPPEQLQPLALHEVHHDDRSAVVVRRVVRADVLQVAAEVGKGKARRRQHPQEPRRAAAVLHVRPARFADRREEERVGAREIGALALAQGCTVRGGRRRALRDVDEAAAHG